MTESDLEKKLSDLTAKIHCLILGYKIGATCLLAFFSLLNLGAALSIPHFHQIFKDALGPDHPMPPLTNCVLACESILPLMTVLWPALGIISVWVFKKLYITVIVPVLLLTLIVVQFALTWISLFMPMVTLVSGMGDAPPSH